MLIKYYSKIGDVDIKDSLKHLIWGALLWMILQIMFTLMIKIVLMWHVCFHTSLTSSFFIFLHKFINNKHVSHAW